MSDTTIETFEHAGLKVSLGYEEDGEFANPREGECNLGTMVCWHTDYVLGDEQMTDGDGRGAVRRDRHGSASTLFQTERGRTDFKSMRMVERYLRLARGAVVTIPLYLYDHSGISISAGAPNPFDNPVVRRDELGRGLGWDTSMVGFIYTSADRIRELCGECPECFGSGDSCGHACARCVGKGWYVPDEPESYGDPLGWIAKQLAEEVDVYDQWLRGEVYWYTVEDAAGEILDACGGFLGGAEAPDGSALDGLGYCRQEACEAAEGEAERLRLEAETEARESAFWAARGVPALGAGAVV